MPLQANGDALGDRNGSELFSCGVLMLHPNLPSTRIYRWVKVVNVVIVLVLLCLIVLPFLQDTKLMLTLMQIAILMQLLMLVP